MSADQLDAEVKRVVDRAPKLTAAQRDKLGALLAVDEPPAQPKRRRARGKGDAA